MVNQMAIQEKTANVINDYLIVKLDEEFNNAKTPFEGWQNINLVGCKNNNICTG